MVLREKSENMSFKGVSSVPCPPPAGIDLTPRQKLIGAVDININRDGTWHHQGAPFTRHALVKLFASVLRRDNDGHHWLITRAEAARITVEDAPLLAVEMRRREKDGVPVLSFRTNVDTWIDAGPDRPLRIEEASDGEPRPYLVVADDGLEARLLPAVFYDLAEQAFEGDINGKARYVVESNDARFDIGATEETA